MKIALFCLVSLHGLIHLMGFVKAFGYAEMPALTQPISKPLGLLWLVVAVLFLGTAVLLWLQPMLWWPLALTALLLSQGLIVSAWKDARFGTVANLILLVAVTVAWRQQAFFSTTQAVLTDLQAHSLSADARVTEADLAEQPPVIQKWLKRTGVVGQPWQNSLYLKQIGRMRTTPDGAWLPFQAEQYFNAVLPGFIWQAQVQLLPGISLLGRDKWHQHHGQMEISALGLFPVVNAAGPEIDQGTLLRYLGELVWFPAAALQPRIKWREVSDNSAEGQLTVAGQSVKGMFYFDAQGHFSRMEALRYFDRKTGPTLEKWRITADPASLKTFSGIGIPTRYTVSWLLQEGDYSWLELEIAELTYNQPASFSRLN